MNVLMIVVDALRADHLSRTGYHRQTTPFLDEFAKECVVFDNAFCPLPNTEPSVTSLLTGCYPYHHEVRALANNTLKKGMWTLPKILGTHGYKTAFMKCGATYRCGWEDHIQQYDLDLWKLKHKIVRQSAKLLGKHIDLAEQYTTQALSYMTSSKKNFFLLLHYNNLHWPYDCPSPNTFDSEYQGPEDYKSLVENGKHTRGELVFGKATLSKQELNHGIARYDASVHFVDRQLKRLIGNMKKTGLDKNTLVIITADHGESFGEHDTFFEHGAFLYNESIKIPLMMYGPTLKPAIITQPVSNVDVLPTVLSLLDIEQVDPLDGINLLSDEVTKKRSLLVESTENPFDENPRVSTKGVTSKSHAVIQEKWKLYHLPTQPPTFELYDLEQDPKEQQDVSHNHPEIVSELKKEIEALRDTTISDSSIEDLKEKSKAVLRKLGYIN